MRITVLLLFTLLAGGCSSSNKEFMAGVDLSMLQHLQDHGVVYTLDGRPTDPLVIFRNAGVNWVRLRLFVDPDGSDGQVNDQHYTLELAKRVKAAGFKLLLNFHYSDAWADPKHQKLPARWAGRSLPQLTYAVRQYTRTVLATFAAEGVSPDMVQVGNECRHGILWPVGGDLGKHPERWDAFVELLRAGVEGVRQSPDGDDRRVMIHIETGGDATASLDFYNALVARGVEFDVIGLSYYPFWQGPASNLAKTLDVLSNRFKRDIVVVEMGSAWAPISDAPAGPYPSTPDGQKQAVEDVVRVTRASRHGRGVFYWAPEWINGPQWNGPNWSAEWEKRALFRPTGEPLPALKALSGDK